LYKLIIQPQAMDFYKKLYSADRSHFTRISLALESLKKDPFRGKALKLDLKGKYSLRIGVYRIIYSVDENIITINILKIAHRRDVYN